MINDHHEVGVQGSKSLKYECNCYKHSPTVGWLTNSVGLVKTFKNSLANVVIIWKQRYWTLVRMLMKNGCSCTTIVRTRNGGFGYRKVIVLSSSENM